MTKIQFDPDEEGGLEIARTVVLERLRTDENWNQYDTSGNGFDRFVDYVGHEPKARKALAFLAQEVLWELIIQGAVAPGFAGNFSLPWFHITEYGKKVLAERTYLPHDPTGYLDRFRAEVGKHDASILAYLSESLNCFTRGCSIASVVMLGVASEKVFLNLCESLRNAIASTTEKSEFEDILKQMAIKPKMDSVTNKIQAIQRQFRAFTDDVDVRLTGIFNFIRCQRNELGHPRENPPKVTREDAYVYLRLFPSYCKIASDIITWLSQNKI